MSNLLVTSFSVAILVTLISIIISFFGALAFARYQWRYRTTFQKLILKQTSLKLVEDTKKILRKVRKQKEPVLSIERSSLTFSAHNCIQIDFTYSEDC